MTEDQARTKWCPMARVVVTHESGAQFGPMNRTESCGDDKFMKPMGSFCIASACMAWRWSAAEPPKPGRRLVWNPDDNEPGAPEPTRPAEAKDWPYTPVTRDDDGDIEGGYWEEPEAEYAARCQEAVSKRPGYCGLAGASK